MYSVLAQCAVHSSTLYLLPRSRAAVAVQVVMILCTNVVVMPCADAVTIRCTGVVAKWCTDVGVVVAENVVVQVQCSVALKTSSFM